MNAFHVCGGVFAAWAVLLAFLGITRENFPASIGAARVVGAISVILAATAIGTAVYVGATEEHSSGGNSHALLPGV